MNYPVTIVIPAYNAENFLAEQLERVTQLELPKESEVLVVNNRSTDSTPSIIDGFAITYSYIKRVDALERSGVNYARNTGVCAAGTDNIFIFDADDLLLPAAVNQFVRILEVADFAGAGYVYYTYNASRNSYSPGASVTFAPHTPHNKPYALGAAMGFKKSWFEKVGGFDESYQGGHDEVDFALRLYAKGAQFEWFPEPVILYRQRDSHVSAFKQKFNYGRTSVQLACNFRSELGETVPGFKMLVRKQVWSIISFFKNMSDSEKLKIELEGLAWTSGRLYGALIYCLLNKLPAREIFKL
ncbi:glycosyltransferase family 2 protein [Rothia sp. ZJ932]|uniref:glycosyltransferase n=1 Tax=Rothia sp. ZJ932 TaxID=2810516 RepID=UPI001968229D|nr:glycosyltransferase family A protein [Rothia sp. ZJ932]QRZ61206.1 glycosyltransferase family 2 protein [Rothia sp. ZJ932]